MTDQKRDDKPAAPFSFENPFSKPDEPAKPATKAEPEMTPAEKAAETRAKNKRAEERAERKAAKEVDEAEPLSAKMRTWSCPACGRGTTLPTEDGPDAPMMCEGCGVESENWLPPGVGHGEPTLQVGPPN